MLNEGLEVLGEDELIPDDDWYSGVFEKSGLRDVRFPSTLKRIEYGAFAGCRNLKAVCFPKELEYLGVGCFSKTGLKNVEFPASLRTISQGSFSNCESLKTARFAEGLKVLGTDERLDNGAGSYGTFEKSALESVQLPSTLKKIKNGAFA